MTEAETKRPVLAKRCEAMGWAVTAENLRRADKQHMGTTHGQMHEAGLLTRRQYEAIEKFAIARRRYLAAIGAPPETAQGASMGAMPASATESVTEGPSGDWATLAPEDRTRRLCEAYIGARAAATLASFSGFTLLWGVTRGNGMLEGPLLARMRIAADALADHYGMRDE